MKGVNVRWKHLKKSQQNPQGGASSARPRSTRRTSSLFDPKAGKGVRVRHEVREGKKVRVSVKTGEVLGGA